MRVFPASARKPLAAYTSTLVSRNSTFVQFFAVERTSRPTSGFVLAVRYRKELCEFGIHACLRSVLFVLGELSQKLCNERAQRLPAFGGFDSRVMVNLVFHRNCDIFHRFTV